MATKSAIISAINSKISGTSASSWRIGLTHGLSERKQHWRDTEEQDVTHWTAWEADSLNDAQDIEASGIRAGMKGGTGGDLSSNKAIYVYIF